MLSAQGDADLFNFVHLIWTMTLEEIVMIGKLKFLVLAPEM